MQKDLIEHSLFSKGYKRIVGIDEVGRGAWAGPLTMAGFALSSEDLLVQGVKDSKLLTPKSRAQLSSELSIFPNVVVSISASELDKIGLTASLHDLIRQIIACFDDGESYFLIDGKWSIKFHPHSQHIIHGDLKCYSIAAASILAKHSRDSYMQKISVNYPKYCFDKHKGYGTAAHQNALKLHGLTSEHRQSFAPIANLLA